MLPRKSLAACGECPNVPGLLVRSEFINDSEEAALIRFISGFQWGKVRMHGVSARRRVAQFGWRYSFESYRLTPAAPIPDQFLNLRTAAALLAGIEPAEFSEVLVTEYPPGAGIGWHRDAPHFGIVAGVSLGGPCRMWFRRGETGNWEKLCVELGARSIYLLSGSIRKDWQHTITPVKALRWSITLRTLRRRPTA